MSSVLLKECICYCNDQNSKLFLCFLDVKTAFDKVWHIGLFYKLHELGINGLLWKSFISLYENVVSSVSYRGFKSADFSVNVGARQGGVSSPFLYLCYIDKLLKDLENSCTSFSINDFRVPCIVSADDMVLLALTKSCLDEMMQTCFEYSCKWRYKFNASKSAVMVCNETNMLLKRLGAIGS